MKRTGHHNKGFTLIETFVAITILITAVAGPLTIASKGLQSAILAKDQLTASFLAQEGIEYIRMRRDSNCLTFQCTNLQTGAAVPNQWLKNLNECNTSQNTNKPCTVDPIDNRIETCLSGTCPALRYDTSTFGGFYSYNVSYAPTNFVRSVQIVPINNREATVSVTVSWKTGPFTRQMVVSEVISDWQ